MNSGKSTMEKMFIIAIQFSCEHEHVMLKS